MEKCTVDGFLLNFWHMYSICFPTLTYLNILKIRRYYRAFWIKWHLTAVFSFSLLLTYFIFIKKVTLYWYVCNIISVTQFHRTVSKNAFIKKLPVILMTLWITNLFNIIKCSHFIYLDLRVTERKSHAGMKNSVYTRISYWDETSRISSQDEI